MANASFAGWEGLIQIGGATAAVVEDWTLEVEQELSPVKAVGDFKPQDLKEVFQNVRWNLKRAYFVDATAADAFTKALRDANGYLTAFTMTLRMRDNSTGVPADKTYTVTGCKAEAYKINVPAGGLVMEDLKGQALNATRA